MGNCKDCKWARPTGFERVPVPDRPKNTWLERWFGSDRYILSMMAAEVQNAKAASIYCKRYPKPIMKHGTDTCGEFTPPEDAMTGPEEQKA